MSEEREREMEQTEMSVKSKIPKSLTCGNNAHPSVVMIEENIHPQKKYPPPPPLRARECVKMRDADSQTVRRRRPDNMGDFLQKMRK